MDSNRSIALRWMLAVGLLLLVPVGCDRSTEAQRGTTPPFVEAGDLADIHQRGVLRILAPVLQRYGPLPREGFPTDFENELVEAFARKHGLETYWVYVESRRDLIPYLLEGKGDLIVANFSVTPSRKEYVTFSVPVQHVRAQVVTRAGDRWVKGPKDLEGRRIAVRRSSSFWETIERLAELHPGIGLEEAPEEMDTEEMIHRVATRRLDITVADSNLVQATMNYRKDVRAAFDLTGDRPVAWAMRPGSRALRRNIDKFLTEAHLSDRRRSVAHGDLPEMKRDRVLRVLTRNSPATYFLWRGELMGFEYELARRFARKHNLRVEIVVPPRDADLFDWLTEGRGDLVAAAVPSTMANQRAGVISCEPYNYISQVVVARADDRDVNGLGDLSGRTLYARYRSANWNRLSELRAAGVDLRLQAAPGQLTSQEIIALVAEDRYDLAVADSQTLDIELTWRSDVRAAFPLGELVPLAWAVRESNPLLKTAVDEFIRTEDRSEFYNVIHRKYFRDPRKMRRHVEHRVSGPGDLSPYDATIKRYANQYDFDWRMIVAQMYQESRFDPEALSFAGAVGLLQVQPRTAEQMGLVDLENPETNIHAALKYLDWLRDRFEPELPVTDRLWFTLAAYNVGSGHVQDARRLAAAEGLNPDRWFGNVELAIQLLARGRYAAATPHGYCRGIEPVRYVSEIRSRYNAYVEMLDPAGLPSAGGPTTSHLRRAPENRTAARRVERAGDRTSAGTETASTIAP